MIRPVTTQALAARINRKLAHDGLRLRSCPERSASFSTLGNWYTVTADTNVVHTKHIDLATWGGELGVLREGEVLT
jgi:hypothetical protein